MRSGNELQETLFFNGSLLRYGSESVAVFSSVFGSRCARTFITMKQK